MNRLSKNEEYIQREMNAHQFPFDEAQWDAAKDLLDRELPVARKKKRRVLWLWFVPLLALLGAGAWYFLTQENNHLPAADSGSAHSFTEPRSDKSKMNPTDAGQLMTETPAGDINEEGRQSSSSSSSLQKQNHKSATAQDEETTVQMGGSPSLMAAQMHQTTKKKTTTTPKNTNPGTLLAGGETTPPSSGGNSEDNNTPPENKKSSTPPLPPAGPAPTKDENPIVGQDDNKIPGDDDDVLHAKGDETIDEEPVDEEEEIPNPDTTANDNKKGKEQKQRRDPKNSISPVVGFNYSYGDYRDSATGSNTRPFFGILYTHRFNDKWQLGVGAGYSTLGITLTKNYNSTVYSFGVQNSETQIRTQTLQYLQFPITGRFSPGEKYTLFGGINAAYLMNTRNLVTENTSGSFTPYTTSSKSANAYRRGINNWDVQLQLGAELNLFNDRRLHTGAFVNLGLTDVSKNTYYNYSYYDRNRWLQFYIRYDIIRFKK